MLSPDPKDLWKDLTPEEQDTYQRWLEAYEADDNQYQAYLRSIQKQDQSTGFVQDGLTAQAVTCETKGTNEKRCRTYAADIWYDSHDGCWSGSYFVPSMIMLGREGVQDYSAWLMPYVNVPPKSIIQYAELVLYTLDRSETLNLTTAICANKATNPSAPVNLTDVRNRPRTTNQREWIITSVDWDMLGDGTATSPNIACVVQELVDQAGWVSGNPMLFFVQLQSGYGISNQGYAQAYDYQDGLYSQLHVWYSIVIDEVGTRGVKCGGKAAVNVVRHAPAVYGGVKATGSSKTFARFREFGSGGAMVNGGASALKIRLLPVSGGARIGGLAVKYRTTNPVLAYGGVRGAGFGYPPWYFNWGTGGMKCGGDHVQQLNFSNIARGGLWASGFVPDGGILSVKIGGGLVVGGGRWPNGYLWRGIAKVIPAGQVPSLLLGFPLVLPLSIDPAMIGPLGFRLEDMWGRALPKHIRRWSGSEIVVNTRVDLVPDRDNIIWLFV